MNAKKKEPVDHFQKEKLYPVVFSRFVIQNTMSSLVDNADRDPEVDNGEGDDEPVVVRDPNLTVQCCPPRFSFRCSLGQICY